jgi:hypothetical protein
MLNRKGRVVFMKALYVLSASGMMFFLTGELSEQDYGGLDKLAQTIRNISKEKNAEDRCLQFINAAKSELNVDLMRISAMRVFRV